MKKLLTDIDITRCISVVTNGPSM